VLLTKRRECDTIAAAQQAKSNDDPGGENNAKSAAQMVAEAKQRVENLTVEQAATELAGGDALLVDLREPN
jgi:hypothetical protein